MNVPLPSVKLTSHRSAIRRVLSHASFMPCLCSHSSRISAADLM